MKTKISQIFTWVIWLIFLVNAINYIAAPFRFPEISEISKVWTNYATYSLIFFSLLEAGLTIIIRHLAIMKPYEKGTYNPRVRFLRFFIVGVVTWIMSISIVYYGTLTYYMLGTLWQHYLFSMLGSALLLFHAPRLAPFKRDDPK